MSMINTNIASGLNIGNLNFANLTKPSSAGVDSDGDNDGSRVARSGGKEGRFAAAIEQTLSQLGVSSTRAASAGGTTTATNSSADSSSSAPQDPTVAMQTFMHDLFAALHAMGNNSPNIASNAQTSSPAGPSNVAASGGPSGHHHRDLGAGEIQGKLQSLIQQLSSTTTSNSADPTLSTLQKDVQNLLGASSGSGTSQMSLAGFLQAISNNLQGNNPGLNVATKV